MEYKQRLFLFYISKIILDCSILIYLLYCSYNFSSFSPFLYNSAFFVDLLISFLLLQNYKKILKKNSFSYIFSSLVNLYVFNSIFSEITSAFLIQTSIIAVLVPLSGYKLYKEAKKELVIDHE